MVTSSPQLSSSGAQIANLVVSTDLLHHAWSDVSVLNHSSISFYESDGVLTTSVSPYLVRSTTFDHDKYRVMVFATVQEQQVLDLPPALYQNHPDFEFLSTKDNPSIRINQTALSLYHSHAEQYQQILDPTTKPLILVGQSLGGAIATLFTLCLLEKKGPSAPNNTLPFCITFGSPLIGDDGLQRAISKHRRWNSRFLHLIANDDPLPTSFISNQEYKPFGTFLFCSQLGSYACVDDHVSVLELMMMSMQSMNGNGKVNVNVNPLDLEQRNNHYGYGEMLQKIKNRIFYSGAVENMVLMNHISSSLQAGLALQLQAIGIGEETQQQLGIFESLIARMEERGRKIYHDHKQAISNHDKKLIDSKIRMANLEWYKKFNTMKHMGYYNCYKNFQSKIDIDVKKHKNFLNQYWQEMAAEAENKPQKEGSAFRTRYLFAGNNYRRMVEPLDIADYYNIPGNKNYLTNGRDHHYSVLEKWHVEGREQRQSRTSASLTEDSCFWAYVEDAIIDLRELQAMRDRGDGMEIDGLDTLRGKMEKFENYVKSLIDKYEVSKDVFWENSSLMQWWREYEGVLGTNYHSPLSDYMKNKMYENYQ